VAPDGSIYFAEVMAKRAQKFVPAGTLVPTNQAKQTLSSIR
jgi:hypothetical protein